MKTIKKAFVLGEEVRDAAGVLVGHGFTAEAKLLHTLMSERNALRRELKKAEQQRDSVIRQVNRMFEGR
jgi:hypothetical protein